MPSLTDLDQGSTFRPMFRYWMGNTIGWVWVPAATVAVTTGGTTQLQLGVSQVHVGSVGVAVTIQLPAFKGTTTATQGTVPGPFVPQPITITDSSGGAGTNTITIQPAAGETISGLPFVQITAPYGAVVLQPDPINGGCILVS